MKYYFYLVLIFVVIGSIIILTNMFIPDSNLPTESDFGEMLIPEPKIITVEQIRSAQKYERKQSLKSYIKTTILNGELPSFELGTGLTKDKINQAIVDLLNEMQITEIFKGGDQRMKVFNAIRKQAEKDGLEVKPIKKI